MSEQLTLIEESFALTVVEGENLQLTLDGGNGPSGAAGPNTVTTSTTAPSLTGYIFSNGTTIAGATAAVSAATANTLVLRTGTGAASFADITASGTVTDTQPTDAATPVNAFTAATSTEAVFNAQKWSPVIKQSAKGWGTTASTSQDVSFSTIVKPTQSTVPTGKWSLQSSIAGGALTDQLTVTSSGTVSSAVSFSAPIYYGVGNTGGILRLDGNAATRGLGIGSLNLVAWSSGAYTAGSVSGDTNLNRATTGGILQIGTTAANALGSLACFDGTFGGAINTFTLTVTGGTTFGEESLIQFDALEYYYGDGAASAHRIALGLGTTDAVTFGNGTFATGSIATSQPLTLTQTWTNAATTYAGLRVNVTNTASNAASLLMDLQVGGTSKLKVSKGGRIFSGAAVGSGTGVPGADGLSLELFFENYGIGANANGEAVFYQNSTARTRVGFGVAIASNQSLGFTNVSHVGSDATVDTIIRRDDAANTLAQRNGTNAQTSRIYNTYTSATNFERLNFRWDSNVAKIGTEKGSGGGTARDLVLETDGTERVRINTAGNLTASGTITATTTHPTASAITATQGVYSSFLGANQSGGGFIGCSISGVGVGFAHPTSSSFFPCNASGTLTTGVMNLGRADYRFNNYFGTNGNFSGTLAVTGATTLGATTITSAGSFTIGDNATASLNATLSRNGAGALLLNATNAAGVNIYGQLQFSNDNAVDIGNVATNRPRNLYVGTGVFAANITASGSLATTPSTRSGPGELSVTASSIALTTTGVADALTLANGTNGQIMTVCHVSRGGGTGTAVLTPATKNGYTTITFTATGDSVTLQYHTTGGWHVIGSRGVTIA